MYVEWTGTDAVCGPTGDCNAVQESPYAKLFGILPVGLLGMVGYATILVSWFLAEFGPPGLKKILNLLVWGMAWFGIAFSIYLTFLEPFVIGATCMWCITSAILITLIFIASTGPAKEFSQGTEVMSWTKTNWSNPRPLDNPRRYARTISYRKHFGDIPAACQGCKRSKDSRIGYCHWSAGFHCE